MPVIALALFQTDIEYSRSLARHKVFRDRLNPIEQYNDVEFISRYRQSYKVYFCPARRESFNIPASINNSIAFNSDNHLISSRTQFLAIGSFQTVVASSDGISQLSISRCIVR